ncbi:MAG TPA: hypothetical protein VM165_12715 [Planctomycetaceae bacterium]|nr:hypothetical protein [Planctomycetaceae bacterium]
MKKLVALLFALAVAVPAAAQTASPASPVDVTGTWDITVTTQQGAIPSQLKLKKDGAKIVGSIASQMGEAPVEAELKDKTLSVWFTMQGQNGPMAIEMVGTVDGDKIKGSLGMGGSTIGDWVATRAKDAAAKTEPAAAASSPSSPSSPSLTGDWNVSVELPNMTATPGLTLKQDGEKVTGEYVSAQYGKFPITGTVKGKDVVLNFSMAIEGNAMNVTYTATIQPDGSLKGSVKYADMMDGTFTATKKK